MGTYIFLVARAKRALIASSTIFRPNQLMFFRRSFQISTIQRLKSDVLQQLENIKGHHVPDLPVAKSIALSSQDLSGKICIDDSKSPLVLIHGLFGARQNYASVGRRISALSNRQTLGIDMRNHGASGHVFPHDYAHMTRDTIRFIETLDKKVVLAGHLMGAKVAMLVALQRPELVEKLIVIDNSPIAEGLDFRFTRDLLAMCRVEQELHLHGSTQSNLLRDVDRIMAVYEPDALVRIFLASNLKRLSKRSDNSEKVKFRVPVMNFVKHDVLAKMGEWPSDLVRHRTFNKPVLVMRGLDSDFITDEHMKSHFPIYFSSFETADFKCGHWLVSEQPERFVRETLQFLGDV